MKKTLKVCLIIAVAAVAAAAAVGTAYHLSSGFRSWIANNAGESEGSSETTSVAATSSIADSYTISADGILKMALPSGDVFKSSDEGGFYHSPVGGYLAVTLTISGSDLTDRSIVADWADQYDPDIRIVDADDNLLDAATTRQTVESGTTIYFRLEDVFEGTRYLMAHPVASAGSVASIGLSCDAASIAAEISSAS
jgi:hypothetical protein